MHYEIGRYIQHTKYKIAFMRGTAPDNVRMFIGKTKKHYFVRSAKATTEGVSILFLFHIIRYRLFADTICNSTSFVSALCAD